MEGTVLLENPRQRVLELVSFFREGPGKGLKDRELYQTVVDQLNAITGRDGKPGSKAAWTYRYVEGVCKGTVANIGKDFLDAVDHLGSTLESSMPPAYAGTEPVQVYALPGHLLPGTLVLGKAQRCQAPGCRVWFVARSANTKYCPDHRGRRKHQ